MSTVVQSKELVSIVVPICGTTHKFELPQWYTNNFPISHHHLGMFEFFIGIAYDWHLLYPDQATLS